MVRTVTGRICDTEKPRQQASRTAATFSSSRFRNYTVVHKMWNIHALRSLSNRTVSGPISVDHCSKGWSWWTLYSSVKHDHSSLQWSTL